MKKLIWFFFVAVMVANIGMMAYLAWDMTQAPPGGVGPRTHANGDALWVAISICLMAGYGLFVLLVWANPWEKDEVVDVVRVRLKAYHYSQGKRKFDPVYAFDAAEAMIQLEHRYACDSFTCTLDNVVEL